MPFDGILAGSEEAGQLKSLFDFLEKDLDSSPCKVQFTDEAGRPFELIGDKFHEAGFTILKHTGIDHADFIRILGIGIIPGEFYPAIAQNDRLLSHKNSGLIHVSSLLDFLCVPLLSHNFETHVFLGPAHPDHALLMQMVQMGKVHICLIENDDFPGADRNQSVRLGRKPEALSGQGFLRMF